MRVHGVLRCMLTRSSHPVALQPFCSPKGAAEEKQGDKTGQILRLSSPCKLFPTLVHLQHLWQRSVQLGTTSQQPPPSHAGASFPYFFHSFLSSMWKSFHLDVLDFFHASYEQQASFSNQLREWFVSWNGFPGAAVTKEVLIKWNKMFANNLPTNEYRWHPSPCWPTMKKYLRHTSLLPHCQK